MQVRSRERARRPLDTSQDGVSPFDGVSFGAPVLSQGLNTAQNDFRPNLRRDGLEIFFDSDRPGGIGGLDLWTSTRASTSAPSA